MRKLATWALVLFIAFYVTTQPAAAAAAARSALGGVHQAATSFANFLDDL
jgi:hypothetical protein